MSDRPMCSLAVLLLGGLTACGSLSRSYPEKTLYDLDTGRPERVAAPAAAPTLQIRTLDVSPAYEGVGFVYRVGENEFESDYYNEFFVAPLAILSRGLAQWISDAGIFAAVVGAGTNLVPDYVLDGSVRTLHADLRDPEAPRTIVEVQLFLIQVRGRGVVYSATYRADPVAAGRTPAELAAGWSAAYAEILARVEADLRTALAAEAARDSNESR